MVIYYVGGCSTVQLLPDSVQAPAGSGCAPQQRGRVAIHGLAQHKVPGTIRHRRVPGGRDVVAAVAAAAANRKWRWAQGIVCLDETTVYSDGVVQQAVVRAVRARFGSSSDEAAATDAPRGLALFAAAAGAGISKYDDKGMLVDPSKLRERQAQWAKLLRSTRASRSADRAVCRRQYKIDAVQCVPGGMGVCGVSDGTTPVDVWVKQGSAPPASARRWGLRTASDWICRL